MNCNWWYPQVQIFEAFSSILTHCDHPRLLVTSVMLAVKFFDDVYYSNAYYAKAVGWCPGSHGMAVSSQGRFPPMKIPWDIWPWHTHTYIYIDMSKWQWKSPWKAASKKSPSFMYRRIIESPHGCSPQVGGVRTREVNALESHFLQLIEWKLHVTPEAGIWADMEAEECEWWPFRDLPVITCDYYSQLHLVIFIDLRSYHPKMGAKHVALWRSIIVDPLC